MVTSDPSSCGVSYRDAGVDIDAGHALLDRIRPALKSTHRPGVLGGIGGFGGLFELPTGYTHPVLVSGTDGVGTKLKLALALHRHTHIGIDLVAMCVNDVIVSGAEPLYFLDYYATGKLDVDVACEVISGIADGCRQAGIALIGGETAEMPGMYPLGEYDLAGFAVGVVEKDRIISGREVAAGDAIIGLASSGPHANGYSLIREILKRGNASLDMPLDSATLGDRLLAPTRIYTRPLRQLLARVSVRAMAHITGGGLPENLPRVLPPGLTARIDPDSWRRPAIFDWLQTQGEVSEREMLRTFNCGVGMAVIVAPTDVGRALDSLNASGESAFRIGTVSRGDRPDAPPTWQIHSPA